MAGFESDDLKGPIQPKLFRDSMTALCDEFTHSGARVTAVPSHNLPTGPWI